MTTTNDLARRLQRDNLSSAEIIALRRELADQRAAVQRRLAAIETEQRAATEAARLVALNQESELLDAELGILFDADARSFRLHEKALKREQLEKGPPTLKRLPKLIEATARAAAEYEAVKRELEDAVTAIGQCRAAMSPDERAKFVVDEAEADRVATLLYGPSNGARIALRRQICKPEPPVYAERRADHSELDRVARSPAFARRDS